MGVNIYCEPLGNHKWINGFGIEASSTKGCPSPSMSFSIISYICQFGSRNILKSGYILVQFCYKMLKSPILGDFLWFNSSDRIRKSPPIPKAAPRTRASRERGQRQSLLRASAFFDQWSWAISNEHLKYSIIVFSLVLIQ